MKKTIILVALDDETEKNKISEILSTQSDEYKMLFPDSLASFDKFLNSYDIDLIILDFQFQNGALADWLSLWPLPFIILANHDELPRLQDLLKDEASLFILRDEQYGYIDIVPLTIKKLFYYRELQTIQNKHIQLSERRYMELVQALPDIVYHIDSEGRFLFINDAVRFLGYEPIELVGKHFSSILHPDEIERVSRNIVLKDYFGKTTGQNQAPKLFDERRKGKRKTKDLVLKLQRKITGDETKDVVGAIIAYGAINSTGFFLTDDNEDTIGTVGIIRDATQNIVKERLLEESNEEKTVLLREVHHRVKNNLQIVLSLINLHADDFSADKAEELLQDIQSEIHSMALVHDQLYRSDSMSKIVMKNYLDSLIDRLIGNYGIDIRNLQPKITSDEIYLSLDTAIPIGLIINEIVSHLLKLSLLYPEEKRELILKFSDSADYYTLLIQDSPDDPKSGCYDEHDVLDGMHLAKLLVEQLNGDIHIGCSGGVKIIMKISTKDLQNF